MDEKRSTAKGRFWTALVYILWLLTAANWLRSGKIDLSVLAVTFGATYMIAKKHNFS